MLGWAVMLYGREHERKDTKRDKEQKKLNEERDCASRDCHNSREM